MTSGIAQLSQLWTLVRFPSSALSPRPSINLASQPSFPLVLSRRLFLLQNVATRTFATVVGISNDPNVHLQPDARVATRWTFMHTSGPDDDPANVRTHVVSIVAHLHNHRNVCIDHYGSQHINASKFAPHIVHHRWYPAPRDGAFAFQSEASGRLLAAAADGGKVDTAEAVRGAEVACAWRLIDPGTGNAYRILCDPTLTVLPPELAGPLPASGGETPGDGVLQTAMVSLDMHAEFIAGLQTEHELVREMLGAGYGALVVMPGVISGWRKGRVNKMVTLEDEAVFRTRKWRGKDEFWPCTDK
jgi:hypothetical protein